MALFLKADDSYSHLYHYNIINQLFNERSPRYEDKDFIAKGTAISVTLPLQEEPYEYIKLFAFFLGLLAEGWYKDIACRKLKCDPDDHFGLLLQSGDNTIGAVTVRPLK